MHGLFDEGDTAGALVQILAERKGISLETRGFEDYRVYKEKQYDRLADEMRSALHMEEIYGILREARVE